MTGVFPCIQCVPWATGWDLQIVWVLRPADSIKIKITSTTATTFSIKHRSREKGKRVRRGHVLPFTLTLRKVAVDDREMPRKPRREFPGAMYHVINRGNYRAWAFRDEKTKAAFETCIFEACVRSGWVLHAFVVMGNHYHLAVETAQGNLVAGMQWLQATFANRFNRMRDERGHLFQGRYKALPVEDLGVLGQVCHYIHLNPVRAGIVSVDKLGAYRHGSYWYLTRPKQRPAFLNVTTALAGAGNLPDRAAGWRRYEAYLAWEAAEGPAGKNEAYVSMTEGWALGSEEFGREVAANHGSAAQRFLGRQAAATEKEARWHAALHSALHRIPTRDRASTLKSAAWKVAVARHLKESTDVSNRWLAEQLEMGSPIYVSKHVGLMRRSAGSRAHELHARIKVKGKT
jgi:putative transposase